MNLGDPANGSLDLGTGDLTIEGWVKTTATSYQSLLGKQTSTGAYWGLAISNAPGYAGRIRASFSNGTTTRQLYTNQRVDDGAWHYFAVTFRRSTGIDLYVDGYQKFLPITLAGSLDNSVAMQIGRLSGYAPFNGSLDDVAIYDRALSTAEVGSHYAEGTRAEGTSPSVWFSAPAAGSTTTDTTPMYAGTLGTARGDLPTATVRTYAGTSASGTPLRTLQVIAGRDGKWSVEDGTALSPGVYTASVSQTDTAGNVGLFSSPVTFTVASPPAPGDDPALIAAGDIGSCGSSQGDEGTAALLGQLTGDIQTIGDNAYSSGSSADFACFNSTWGAHKSRIHPALGDHEYDLGNANPYFAYFGAAAGDPAKGYYSYNLGTWHVVVLNPVCAMLVGGCAAGGAQETWLRSDLAANPRQCTVAVISAPRFSSGAVHGNDPDVSELWKALHDHGADVVLSGDDHVYERFAPQTADGLSDAANGIRQFTVGTGGYYTYTFGPTQPLSEERREGTHGVMRLVLRSGSYDWRFHSIAGSSYTDTGTASCH